MRVYNDKFIKKQRDGVTVKWKDTSAHNLITENRSENVSVT